MGMLLTLQQAAAELNEAVKVSALRTAIHRKELPARRIGKQYFIARADLETFARCPAPESPPDSTSAPMTAPGSSETAAEPSGRALAETAADALLKKR